VADPERERPVIGFLTDFGFDGAAAICRAVMLGICRDAQIVDIAHTVRKFSIADGAYLLRTALPYFPVGIHVAVVDPGVGTERRPLAVRTRRGDVLVGPDNGLLLPAAEALDGMVEARELTNRDLWLAAPSFTFHGRDIFSPVAAHLANGDADFEAVGPMVEAASLVRLTSPSARAGDGELETTVIYVDSFGNARLAGGRRELEAAFGADASGRELRLHIGDRSVAAATLVPSFGHVAPDALALYVDSGGNLAIGVNQGDFARRFGVETGTAIRLEDA
jgi:S-adenosylmethionine hydrolase